MEHLLKTSAVIAIFYVCYKLFLQRETFFEHNRWFLLMGLITSFLIPFLVIPIYVETTPLDLSNFVFETATTENVEKPFSILDYLPIIYGIGVGIFTLRFFVQFASLAWVIFKNKGEKIGGFIYIETNGDVSPFSFFNWIVCNPTQFTETELNQIMTHEKVHATQKHSIDILLTHLSCIMLWFNPVIWLYNKALKQNLEFIADKETANITSCKKSYQYTLLKTSMPSHQMALSTNFYNSLIKKRIVMLHKSKSKKINQLKYALVIPVLGLFLMGFNTKEVYVEKVSINSEKTNQEKPPLYFIDGKETSKKEADNLNPQRIESINVLKGKVAIEKYGNKGKNGVIEITTKEKETAINNSKSLPEVKVIGYGNKDDKNPLYIVDGKEIDQDIMNSIDPNTIDKIDVLKGEHATRQYGEKGKNGVVLITLKSEWNVSAKRNTNVIFAKKDTIYVVDKPNVFKNYSKNFDKQPLYILDGKEIDSKQVATLDELTIESVSEIKERNYAVEKYGKKAKNGVVEIKTRTDKSKSPVIKIVGNALYIVDGKEMKKEDFDLLKPENIESMNVLKGDTATKKYSDKGKNGVIEITTKEKK